MIKNFVAILVILLASIVISLPLLKPGLYVIHDDQQIARLFLFDEALKSGQFPVRWVDGLGFGFGYPLFVFYPPFVYMLGELFHLIGSGFINSIKLVFFASIIASGFAMYILAKEFWDKYSAVVASVFYLLVPYRALDIYVRGALSTHNLIFLPFMLILPVYLLFLIWKAENKKLFIVNCLSSIVYSFGLSAFFWLPALLEKKYTIVDQLLLVNLANYNIHFIYPQQLWNWPWGFGGSAAGLTDGISFKIGKLHVFTSIAASVLAIAHLIRLKLSGANGSPAEALAKAGQLSIVFFVLFLFSAFMTTFYSKPIWDLIPPLAYTQFPWRFLIFTSLFSSILAGALVYLLRLPILRLIASLILVVLLAIPNFKLFKPQTYRPDLTDEIATSEEIKVQILSGLAQINSLNSTPSKINFIVNAKDPLQVRVNVFNFPGWNAKVDGKKFTIADNNRLKLITLNIPEGVHRVEIQFKDTFDRFTGNIISLTSLLILFFFIIRQWKIRDIH
ncbi:MAG: Membrane protein, 6-pyruvoyl-tetrahydropterin synthase-related domain protein [Candidatus Curtissbacteria bacterium GW2011_GWA2_41_24]|uniref:Membrane protein, 6-pyruvoyl-tetrahydropterin synthase-related domain protein n=1 Tax=Candidatus Curtissbacteria bacterium GW2011_GWA2_41_24 TaxID=1618411 RepID=A0A0G0VTH1_9BACT|nr:MAG: Membrane protein, 6-pyruvoyl-tetrahydropterin synthase-related domain protein [Candidatus Curtissbacteria bacterium GW2011_GWA2_41_24]